MIGKLFEKLNYSKRTELTLKDFVREVNCLTGKNWRMGDLYKISERLRPMSRENFIRKFVSV